MTTWSPQSPLAKVVDLAGFAYDPAQDILYSKMDALQRSFGYAYAFDANALTISADLDCEPIFFEYNNKLWMIELWKGQYGLETGCEIGVYNRPVANPPAYYSLLDTLVGARPIDPVAWHGLFFQSVGPDEMLEMTLTLTRAGQTLFTRPPQRHWWLTGFRWGVDSKPADLLMSLSITFPNATMSAAFVQALKTMGYNPTQSGLAVSFDFTTPRAPQPPRDTRLLASVQAGNAAIVATYDSYHLPNNDPNTVPGAVVNQVVNSVAQREAGYFGVIVANALQAAGRNIQEISNLFISNLGFAADTVAAWITEAGYTLANWIESIYTFLHDTFTMNFSSAVEIVNKASKRQERSAVDVVQLEHQVGLVVHQAVGSHRSRRDTQVLPEGQLRLRRIRGLGRVHLRGRVEHHSDRTLHLWLPDRVVGQLRRCPAKIAVCGLRKKWRRSDLAQHGPW